MREDLTDEVNGTSDVDIHDEVEVREREGVEVSVKDLNVVNKKSWLLIK